METYVANVGTQTGVSPAIITAILALISQFIGMCPKPPTPAQAIAGGGIFGAIMLNRAVREEGSVRPRSEEGKKLIAVMQAEAAHVSEGDAAMFLTMSATV